MNQQEWILREILKTPGVYVRTGRWGATQAIYSGKVEVAHFHGPDELDIKVSRAVARKLMAAIPPDGRGKSAKWIAVPFRDRSEAKAVLAILGQALTQAEMAANTTPGSMR